MTGYFFARRAWAALACIAAFGMVAADASGVLAAEGSGLGVSAAMLAMVAAPALFLALGALAADDEPVLPGVGRAALVRALLSVFVIILLARIALSTVLTSEIIGAFQAGAESPRGHLAALPGLAGLLASASRLGRLRPGLLIGFAIGLLVFARQTGIAVLDAFLALAPFFLIGLALRAELGRLLARCVRPLSRPVEALARHARAFPVVFLGLELPLNLIGRAGPEIAIHLASVLAVVLCATLALVPLAERQARLRAARRLVGAAARAR